MVRWHSRTLAALAAFAVVLAMAPVLPASAATPTLGIEQKITEAGSASLGWSASLSGNTALVGSSGNVFVYTRYHNTWQKLQSLNRPDGTADDGFGLAVDIDGGLAVVGAPMQNSAAGAAYVYVRSGSNWYYQGKLTASDGEAGDRFGDSVTIDGTMIAIGATGDDGDGNAVSDGGAAYAFSWNGTAWEQTQKLTPAELAAGDYFGHALCLDGTTLAVTAPFHDSGRGLVLAYTLSGTTFGTPQSLQRFNSSNVSDPQAWTMLGCSIAVRGNTLLVGGTGPVGGVWAFVRDEGTWLPQDQLEYPGWNGDELYGWSVSICNDAALVGAPLEGGKGAALYFTRSGNTWTYERALPGTGAASGDQFGFVAELYCTVAIVGAPTPQGAGPTVAPGTAPGSVYFYSTSEATPVYRFYNTRNGSHFYTDSQTERDSVFANYSRVFRYEGVAYMVNPGNNDQPLYRFYNKVVGSHFYTASADERDMVIRTWPNVFQYDGPTYAVSLGDGGGAKVPVWRFYNMRNGSHFYTASADERDMVTRTWGNVYRFEGPAFYLGQ